MREPNPEAGVGGDADEAAAAPAPLLVRRAYDGVEILLTGASGFVAKVWLMLLLDRVPEVERIWLVLRAKDGRSATQRFEDLLNTTPLFAPLHERLGPQLEALVRRKVRVLEGDVTRPSLGLSADTLQVLRRRLDLVVHCAGEVDFNPDLREAVATNVDGTLAVLELAQSCAHARLLHVSTCFVAGCRQGLVPEVLQPDVAPNGDAFDAEAELVALRAACAALPQRATEPEAAAEIERQVQATAKERGWSLDDAALLSGLRDKTRAKWLKAAAVAEGLARARRWGWRNIYTYSKGLAERLVVGRKGSLPVAVVRPSIVESSLRYPFPSWNDGLNTSAPIVYLLGTWFRFYPAQQHLAFDVIPVDMIAAAMTVVGAALLEGVHQPLYQLGSSDQNLFTMGRACELSALAHRRWLRQNGGSLLERAVKSRWDAVPVHADHAWRIERVAQGAAWLAARLGELPADLPGILGRAKDRLQAIARNGSWMLGQTDRLLKMYRPFIHDDHAVFECRAIHRHQPDDPTLAFDAAQIEWRTYWMETHVDGLRRWCWPLLEGKEPERYEAEHPVRLPHDEIGPLPAGADAEALV